MSDKKECSGEMIPANINDILEGASGRQAESDCFYDACH